MSHALGALHCELCFRSHAPGASFETALPNREDKLQELKRKQSQSLQDDGEMDETSTFMELSPNNLAKVTVADFFSCFSDHSNGRQRFLIFLLVGACFLAWHPSSGQALCTIAISGMV